MNHLPEKERNNYETASNTDCQIMLLKKLIVQASKLNHFVNKNNYKNQARKQNNTNHFCFHFYSFLMHT